MPLAVMLQEASKTHQAKISRLPPFPRQVATHGEAATSTADCELTGLATGEGGTR